MSPSARLIGYYIDDNGNAVADSILLEVEDSLPTEVIKIPVFPWAIFQIPKPRIRDSQILKSEFLYMAWIVLLLSLVI